MDFITDTACDHGCPQLHMKIICSHCHSDNAPDARLCQHCGRPVEGQVGSSEPSDAQTTLRWTEAPVRTKPGLRRWMSLDQLFAKKSKILIGRTPECDLMLAHPMVSRRHAELERTPQGLCLTDLGSTNGIAIGG